MAKKKSRPVASLPTRPKSDRKPARRPDAKSIDFPIDKLPAELVHMICAYLKPTELASLRLVSRTAAPISLQYMVPEVHLILAKDSFEQLQALAEHPIASRYVTSFFFEADKLRVFPRTTWESLVLGPQFVAQVEELRRRDHRCHHTSERSLRTYNRENNKLDATPRHLYTEEQLDDAFMKYSDIVLFQQDYREACVQAKKIAEAMKQFSHLKKITLSNEDYIRQSTSKLRKTLNEPSFCNVYKVDNPRDYLSGPIGLHQMRSLLLGAHHAGLKVEYLHCGAVSWRILQQDAKTFTRMKNSISNVKNLRLEFATGLAEWEDYLRPKLEIEKCYSYLEKGRLRDLVTAAPKLEHLQLGFQSSEPSWPTHLNHIFGSHHWPNLQTVRLKHIGTSEDDLVTFCTLHASTLKTLQLYSVGLLEGDWFPVFSRMRKVLALDTMVVLGRLDSPNEELDFDEDSEDFCPELKEGIEAYFLGPCSKEGDEELSLVDFLDIYLPNIDDGWSELYVENGLVSTMV